MRKRKLYTFPKGESHYNTSTRDSTVAQVLALRQEGLEYERIAKKINKSLSSVYFTCQGYRRKYTAAKLKVRKHKAHSNRTLDATDVWFIRDTYKNNAMSQNSLAELFNLSQPVIFDIVHRRTYKDVT